LERRVVSKEIWEQMKNAALEVFKRGTEICDEAGIILADTKYEFGIRNGKLVLIDEVHTPDSSRFWLKSSYDKKLERGQEPESYDKEPLRIWFKEQGYTGDGEAPVMPDEFLVKMSELYQGIHEKITGKTFEPFEYPIEERIKANIQKSL
jgi:phosphoribosylaminoimidazole-succinocarboxamide synthase